MKPEPSIFEQADPAADAAADKRALDDIKAGRVVDHDEVAAWLEALGYARREASASFMARIVWTREALASLEAIRIYITSIRHAA